MICKKCGHNNPDYAYCCEACANVLEAPTPVNNYVPPVAPDVPPLVYQSQPQVAKAPASSSGLAGKLCVIGTLGMIVVTVARGFLTFVKMILPQLANIDRLYWSSIGPSGWISSLIFLLLGVLFLVGLVMHYMNSRVNDNLYAAICYGVYIFALFIPSFLRGEKIGLIMGYVTSLLLCLAYYFIGAQSLKHGCIKAAGMYLRYYFIVMIVSTVLPIVINLFVTLIYKITNFHWEGSYLLNSIINYTINTLTYAMLFICCKTRNDM